jgi:ADP-ribose pyrophosphatase
VSVFVYGTLLDDVLRARLLGRDVVANPSVLHGFEVREQREAPLPAIVRDEGKSAYGLLLDDLTVAEIGRLHAYEVPFDYKPVTTDVYVAGTHVVTQVYLPGLSVSVSDRVWSLERWQDQSGPLSREMAVEIGSFDPPLAGDALRRQWHMIALRASVRLRARTENSPAAVRYLPNAGDFKVNRGPDLSGDFFRMASLDISHRTFLDEMAGPLHREVFVGTDAAVVLPYDPKTDRVLLVEQIRMGPFLRGAPNPWTLEPIAGMIDDGETIEQAALRESEEEAGLQGITLEKMFSFYPSTGSATDYFYCFAGYCDLPECTTYTGGLADESEDLRLHVLPFDDAFDLIATGEANMGALISMLLWLSCNRQHLRAAA